MDYQFRPENVGAKIMGTSEHAVKFQEFPKWKPTANNGIDGWQQFNTAGNPIEGTWQQQKPKNTVTDHFDTLDEAAGVINQNIEEFLDIELRKYILQHAAELGVRDSDAYRRDLIETILHRNRVLHDEPLYKFCYQVAGTLGETIESVIYSQTKMHTTVRELVRVYANDVAKGVRRSELSPFEFDEMLQDEQLTGRIRMKPELEQAHRTVMSDLRSKRGAEKLPSFDKLIRHKNPDVLVRLAEATGYQMMTFRQLDKRRTYLDRDYNRVKNAYARAIVDLVGLLVREKVMENPFKKRRYSRTSRCDFD